MYVCVCASGGSRILERAILNWTYLLRIFQDIEFHRRPLSISREVTLNYIPLAPGSGPALGCVCMCGISVVNNVKHCDIW